MQLVKNAGYMQLVKNAMWRPENNSSNYVIVNTHFETARSTKSKPDVHCDLNNRSAAVPIIIVEQELKGFHYQCRRFR
jgi:hypothetical protein